MSIYWSRLPVFIDFDQLRAISVVATHYCCAKRWLIGRCFEHAVGCLNVVFQRDLGIVADPAANDVLRVRTVSTWRSDKGKVTRTFRQDHRSLCRRTVCP